MAGLQAGAGAACTLPIAAAESRKERRHDRGLAPAVGAASGRAGVP